MIFHLERDFSDQFTFILMCPNILEVYFTVVRYSMTFCCTVFWFKGSSKYQDIRILVQWAIPFHIPFNSKVGNCIVPEGNENIYAISRYSNRFKIALTDDSHYGRITGSKESNLLIFPLVSDAHPKEKILIPRDLNKAAKVNLKSTIT